MIDYLADYPQGRSLSEVARHFELPLSSTHNLLQTLAKAHVLTSEEKRYALGPLALSLGVRLSDAVDVRRVARPHLASLVERIEDDVYLGIVSGETVMYVDHYPGKRRLSVTIRTGQRLYLHSTATGKLFAALDPRLRELALSSAMPRLTAHTTTDAAELSTQLDEIRDSGVSITRQESFEGIAGVAVPIWDRDGSLKAAIHVSLLLSDVLEERIPVVVEEMRAAARAIEAEDESIDGRLEKAAAAIER